MEKIARKHQILVITHLASIAARGDYNYYIYKEVQEGSTRTKVRKLEENEVIEEIARIASGEVTKTAIEHAKELRENKLKDKEGIEKIASQKIKKVDIIKVKKCKKTCENVSNWLANCKKMQYNTQSYL